MQATEWYLKGFPIEIQDKRCSSKGITCPLIRAGKRFVFQFFFCGDREDPHRGFIRPARVVMKKGFLY